MEDSDDALWSLIGLTGLDARVYRGVLSDPAASTRALAEAVECSPARVRAAVDRLTTLGLLRARSPTGKGFEPVEPLAAIGMLLREHRSRLDRIEAVSHDLSRIFATSLMRTEPRRLFEVVEGAAATATRIQDLLGTARTEAVGIDTPPYVAAGSSQVSDAEVDLLARGVRFRSLYASEVLEDSALTARIHEMSEQGEQPRVLPAVPIKLLIIDKETAVIPLTGGEGGRDPLSIVAAPSALTDGLQSMFEQLWTHATPIRLGREAGLGARRTAAQLVDLLGTGITDDSIARHLGVSPRTLRRRIATLEDELDATGRFQAGVRAAQRGWV
ncbi:MAG: hypothetical protein ACRDQA_13500 [Nocardioidaceae bacterium]